MPQYKNENTGKWYCSFYYTDWQGKRKKKKKEGFKTKREAKEWENEFVRKSSADCTMSFKSLVELYKADCEVRLKEVTVYSKFKAIEKHILPFFSDMSLNSITPLVVRQWQTELITKSNNYKPGYLNNIQRTASSIFNFACKYYNLSSNPVRECGVTDKAKSNTMQFWTLDEFNKFINVVDDETYKIVFDLLYYSGMRKGEMLALTLNDFDFTAGTVNINKTYKRLNGKDIITTPKTEKSNRTITLPQFIIDEIQDYTNKLYNCTSEQRIFNTVTHGKLFYRLKHYCNISGVKNIRVHDIRHSHASLLIELGFSPLLISERLGHDDVQTTLKVYSHLYPNKHSEVALKLDELHNYAIK